MMCRAFVFIMSVQHDLYHIVVPYFGRSRERGVTFVMLGTVPPSHPSPNQTKPNRQRESRNCSFRRASQVPVQPDSVTEEHRVEQVSTASECDLSPRHAAVVTRSEELETPPKSPAISTGLDKPGVSPAFEADSSQTEESFFPFEASMDDLLDKVTSTKQEVEPALLHQRGVGVDDGEKATTTTEQAAAREKSTRPTIRQLRTTASSTLQSKQFDRGRLKLTVLISD